MSLFVRSLVIYVSVTHQSFHEISLNSRHWHVILYTHAKKPWKNEISVLVWVRFRCIEWNLTPLKTLTRLSVSVSWVEWKTKSHSTHWFVKPAKNTLNTCKEPMKKGMFASKRRYKRDLYKKNLTTEKLTRETLIDMLLYLLGILSISYWYPTIKHPCDMGWLRLAGSLIIGLFCKRAL